MPPIMDSSMEERMDFKVNMHTFDFFLKVFIRATFAQVHVGFEVVNLAPKGAQEGRGLICHFFLDFFVQNAEDVNYWVF